MRSWTLAALCLIGFAVPESTRPVVAGTALRLTLPELTARADTVFEGRVLAVRYGRAASGLVYTDYDVSVSRALVGAELGHTTVRLPGGLLLEEGIGLVVPGLPTLALGEDVLLFLTAPEGENLRMPIGLSQGKFRVVTDLATGAKTLVRAQSGLELLDHAGGFLSPADDRTRYDYAETIATIHANLAQGGR